MSTSAEWEDDDERNTGLDCGNATLKLVLLYPGGKVPLGKNGFPTMERWFRAPAVCWGAFSRGPGGLRLPGGHHRKRGDRLKEGCDALAVLGEIPAIHLGVRLLAPEARSAIEIGSQSARFLTGLDQNTPPRFAVNEHCAGGTGSFFEDQMSRLGLKLEDYSRLVGQARSIPRLSGRCAVFGQNGHHPPAAGGGAHTGHPPGPLLRHGAQLQGGDRPGGFPWKSPWPCAAASGIIRV